MTIEQILGAIAPQLINDPDKSTHISLAIQRTSENCFGVNYTLAVALRAAHTLTLKNIASGGGASSVGSVTSKKEGDLNITYGGTSSIKVDGDLGTTQYGIQLDALINGQIIGMSVLGEVSIPC